MEQGLDSLGAVELRGAIAAAFSISVPATITFDHPTVRLLAQHLSTLLPAESSSSSSSLAVRQASVPSAGVAADRAAVLTCIMEVAADLLQCPITPAQPFMEVWMFCRKRYCSWRRWH